MKLKITPHVQKLKESATLAINLKAKQLRAEGNIVHHWGFGQSPFPVPECIQQELKTKSHHKEYLPTNGLIELRTTLSCFYKNHHHLDYTIENIFIGPGSKELIFQLIYLLDANYFIPAPSWVSYGPQVTLKGEAPHFIHTTKENNYKLTKESLEKALTPYKDQLNVLILNSPSNPTGQFYNEDELTSFVDVLRSHNTIVISDEIYHQVNFAMDITPSIARFYPEGTIITGGLSKAQAAGGYRLGYMIIPNELEEIIAPLKSMISETFSAVAAPIQYAAIKGFDDNSEIKYFLKKTTLIHKTIAEYFYQRYTAMNIFTPKPQGAFYLFIDFSHYQEKFQSHGVHTSEELARFLLEKIHLALLPGADFYYPSEILTARIAFVDYDGDILFHKLNDQFSINDIIALQPQIKESLDKLENFLYQL